MLVKIYNAVFGSKTESVANSDECQRTFERVALAMERYRSFRSGHELVRLDPEAGIIEIVGAWDVYTKLDCNGVSRSNFRPNEYTSEKLEMPAGDPSNWTKHESDKAHRLKEVTRFVMIAEEFCPAIKGKLMQGLTTNERNTALMEWAIFKACFGTSLAETLEYVHISRLDAQNLLAQIYVVSSNGQVKLRFEGDKVLWEQQDLSENTESAITFDKKSDDLKYKAAIKIRDALAESPGFEASPRPMQSSAAPAAVAA